jgi:filamentous hemagglutinin family protein
MRAMQQNAAAAARAAARSGTPVLPNNQTVNGSRVIPNGLAVNWLHPDPVLSWKGASIDMAKTTSAGSSGDHNIEITQSEQNAYLYWKNFNIGPRTTINFNQSAGGADVGKWIAFNKITGNASPSSIYGKITAQGQVYILNQNGIMFHNGSEVNVHALVASTLPINENLAGSATKVGRGIANNPDSQFLFSALKVPGNPNKKTDAFTPVVSAPIGDVKVERGATLTAPVNANNTGGLIALIGPNVLNRGAISTPNGQTILASGLQVGLTPHNAADPSLRGMDVTVGRVADPDNVVTAASGGVGTTRNDGILSAFRGTTTMAGRMIVQNGGIESSTSVDLNGRIDLLASYNAVPNPDFGVIGTPLIREYEEENTGLVETGPGSVIRILPEWGSDKTLPGTTLPLSSVVHVVGRTISLGEGSILLAPGANATAGALSQNGTPLLNGVTLDAGRWIDRGGNESLFAHTEGRIDLGPGAEINVAGSTGVRVESSRNFLKLQLRGAELADSPLQRENKAIRGKDITVDIRIQGTYDGVKWYGTPLGDVSGYVNLIGKTAAELTTGGGSVALSAGEAVVTAPGSSINVSGGWVQYSGGKFSTTKLLYRGAPVDISKATPDLVYDGIYKGAVAEFHEAPYVSGAGGGSISIQASSVALDGSLFGNTVAGPRQIRNAALQSELPATSSFSLDLSREVGQGEPRVSPYAPSVTFSRGPAGGGGVPLTIDPVTFRADPLPVDRRGSVTLSSDLLSRHGFGKFSVASHDGDILLPAGVTLDAGWNGSVQLDGANVTLLGSILSPGGTVGIKANLTPYTLAWIPLPEILDDSASGILVIKSGERAGEVVVAFGEASGGFQLVRFADGTEESLPLEDLAPRNAGVVTMGRSSRIDTSGAMINPLNEIQSGSFSPVVLDGGTVTIRGYSVNLRPGSTIDVSAGYRSAFLRNGADYGTAGSISLSAGSDASFNTIHRGTLVLGAGMSGYGGFGSQGGSLSLSAPAFRIARTGDPGTPDPRVNLLDPAFFNRGGFSSFSITGTGLETADPGTFLPGVTVAGRTVIRPTVTSFLAGADGRRLFVPSGGLATAPSLKLAATGLEDGSRVPDERLLIRGGVVVEEGASITLDPQLIMGDVRPSHRAGSLEITAPVVSFAGKASVPGGSITLAGGGKYPSNDEQPVFPQVTLDLTPSATLSVAGATMTTSDPLFLRARYGTVLPGGTVSLAGNIVARAGAVINASGSSATLDFLPYQLGMDPSTLGRGSSPSYGSRLDSAGGMITLNGSQLLRSDATLIAPSGGSTAQGGTLSVSSGRFDDKIVPFDPRIDTGLTVTQTGPVIPDGFVAGGDSAIGLNVPPAEGIPAGGGQIAVSSFSGGGFHNLNLEGNLLFSGPVSITLPGILKAGTGGILGANARTELSARAVMLGRPFLAPLDPADPRRSHALDAEQSDLFAPPTWGEGELIVRASLIDIGNTSLQGVGTARFDATGGVIRGNGAFVMAGDLTLKSSIIYPVTGADFTAVAFNHDDDGAAVSSGGTKGSITVLPGGSASLPLSALGSLSLQADTITQSGMLSAPFGTITLGREASGSGVTDPMSGLQAPVTSRIVLSDGSVTTVSGIDRLTGGALSVPYGTSIDGTSWTAPSEKVDSTDPAGTEITGTGLRGKSVVIGGAEIQMEGGSVVDLRGGGLVTARQWVSGLRGTKDILNDDSGSWAILPGYGSPFTPKGYGEGMVPTGSTLILRQGIDGLPAGTYTLLPSSYGTLPGAYLVSRSGESYLSSRFIKPDGTAILAGTLHNGLASALSPSGVAELFEISSPGVISSKSEYRILNGDTFFSALPSSGRGADGGNLKLLASSAMNLAGTVSTLASQGGRAASIDVAGSSPILVTGSSGPWETPADGTIQLDATILSSWKAGSLLIGGTRSITPSGEIKITPITGSLTVDAGARLEGAEVTLAAAPKTHVVKSTSDENGDWMEGLSDIADAHGVSVEDLMLANGLAEDSVLKEGQILKVPGSHASVRLSGGASVISSGGASPSSLLLEGNGALLRVGHSEGTVRRTGFDPIANGIDGTTPLASLVLGKDVLISGDGVTLDSTSETTVDPLASITAKGVRLSSGLISVNGEDSGALALSGRLLEGLNSSKTLKSLSLTSYSTMILHDGSVLGSENLGSLVIRAAAITGSGGSASLKARALSVDNGSGSSLPDSYTTPETIGGTLEITAETLSLGNGQLRIEGFQTVSATARDGMSLGGKGGLAVAGNVEIKAPVIIGLGGASTGIRANGTMVMDRVGNDSGALKPGLGASLTLAGSTVTAAIPVLAPSGSISIQSTSGDLNLSALLDVGGTAKSFPGVIKYTDAGVISLASQGGIKLSAGSDLNLSAQAKAGSAGTLRLTAPNGTLIMEGSPFRASKGNGGKAGTFLADLFGYNGGNLDPLQGILKPAGFTEKQDLRIRNGDVTLADATARSFRLSADSGSITVTGTINASGKTGGTIGLFAGQSVILESGSVLNVHGDALDAAGKGGLINLEAGSSPSAVISSQGRGDTKKTFASDISVIDLKSGGKLLLGVGSNQKAGTVMLKAPQTADTSDLQINPIFSTIEKAESIIAVGNNKIDAAGEGAVSIDPIKRYYEVALPLPGQSVIGEDGGVYKLTMDANLYAQFISNELAPGEIADPATSPYWTRTAPIWDSEVDYTPGAKAVGYDGLIYTASAVYPSDGTKPEPGTEEGASAWTLAADEGNYKALALRNAETFDQAMVAPDRKNFAGAYADRIRLRPGQEIVNSSGGLLLNSDWDLSLARYGERLVVLDAKGAPVPWSGSGPTDSTETYQMIGREPGLLSLRAAGDITFRGSLSDGFGDSVRPAADVDFVKGLYYAPLIPLLARGVTEGETATEVTGVVRQDSWSYRISAGSDFSSALPDAVSGGEGDIVIGVPGNPLPEAAGQSTSAILKSSGQYQVIRTGTGDIALSAARDMQLLSPFASVYTAGAVVTDPTLGGRFDLPVVNLADHDKYNLGTLDDPYPVQYASGGGNILIQAGRDITRLNALLNENGDFQYDSSGNLRLTADSSLQLPSNWLMRRGAVDPATGLFDVRGEEVLSTTWWVDYSNFFQDVGALGGGNIVMNAGRDVANMSASIPTSYRMPGRDTKGNPIAPSINAAVELGGGNLSVTAGNNIDAGVYYLERGQGSLKAGGGIITNPTRDTGIPAVTGNILSTPDAWLPTTLFLGKGSFAVQAGSDMKLGPVSNVFLTPQSVNNSLWYKTYFSTYSSDSSVSALSLAGNMTLAGYGATELDPYPHPLLRLWYDQQLGPTGISSSIASSRVPWIRSSEFQTPFLEAQLSLAPATFSASALGGGITLQGNLTTAPAPRGDLSLVASGAINGLASTGSYNGGTVWMSSSLNLSDASPANLPGVTSPLSKRSSLTAEERDDFNANAGDSGGSYFTDTLSSLFTESGSYSGNRALIETKQVLHDPTLLHKGDPVPLRLIASGGDISGLTLYSAKRAEVVASGDISDVGLYIQNLSSSDISLVSAGGSFRGYDPASQLRASALEASLLVNNSAYAQEAFPSGDIQISGPGTLQLLAGKDIDLGNAPLFSGDSTIWVGLTSIGNARNPALPFQGADIVAGAGLNLPRGLSTTPNGIGLAEFTRDILNGEGGDIYLSELDASMTYSGHPFGKRLTRASFEPGSTDLTAEEKALAQLQLFYIVLRDTGRNYNKPTSPGYRSYKTGEKAIAALFANPGSGSIKAWARDIRTKNGGNISIVAPGGGLSLSSISTGSSLTPPGIITESGGGINIFTRNSVDIGIGRIFTLRGGDITIWSDKGDIAAGFSAKTVASAPPTRVLIDPQSGDVVTDLAGLATGGGIGVLATVPGIPEGSVDLIAPTGVIDAGDAGIRSTGNLNLAADMILNADNILAGGVTVGAPPPAGPAAAPPAAAPPAAPPAGATAAAATGNTAAANAGEKNSRQDQAEGAPSIISVDVLGYGGGDGESDDEKKAANATVAPVQASL